MVVELRRGVAIRWAVIGLLLAISRFVGLSLDRGSPNLVSATLLSGFVSLILAVSPRTRSLDHPIRKRIYEHLLRLPGDYFQSIVRSLHLGHGNAYHHLTVLVTEGWLELEKRNGRARYYPKGLASASDWNDLFARHWTYRDLRVRVLFAVVALNGAGPSEVARQLGISRQLAAYHLIQLERASVLRREAGAYRIQDATRSPKETGP